MLPNLRNGFCRKLVVVLNRLYRKSKIGRKKP